MTTTGPTDLDLAACRECGNRDRAQLQPVYDQYSSDILYWLCEEHARERAERLARFYAGE